MIMPCVNSTSACDRGGSVPVVDAGNVRPGLPGAPGWTTTGFTGAACCFHAAAGRSPAEQKKLAETLAASNSRGEFSLCAFSEPSRSNQPPQAARKPRQRYDDGAEHRPTVRAIAMLTEYVNWR